MKDVTIDISSVGFPSQFVSDAEKATDEFGLQIGQAIQYEWFKKDGNNCMSKHLFLMKRKSCSLASIAFPICN